MTIWNPAPSGWLPTPTTSPRPREIVFEFVRARDHRQFRCALPDHGEYGISARIFMDGAL